MEFIKAMVVGTRMVQYQNRSGRNITGTEVYFTHKDSGVVGLRSGSVFVGSTVDLDIELGKEFSVLYDPYNYQRRYTYVEVKQ